MDMLLSDALTIVVKYLKENVDLSEVDELSTAVEVVEHFIPEQEELEVEELGEPEEIVKPKPKLITGDQIQAAVDALPRDQRVMVLAELKRICGK